ncbi:MAG: tRNA nucleotidyltransferase [Variovorax paradoxus]|uniref:tRNA nucleotidyltransferase n=1 Tax=Variovorax paradoxus TaxID=34073 RepID=A0A2W5PRA2_VARPD|nr:MAG: tRNA nucleotidyltransferase [Variovorax paradoxus]
MTRSRASSTVGQQLIRLALGAAQSAGAAPDAADLASMVSAVQRDAIERLTPAQAGAALQRALLSPYPAGFFLALRACAGLRRFLPELDALFGVPQLSDEPLPVDVGEHQLRALAMAARRHAPLAVRFAVLAHKFGMASHVGHELRGQARLRDLASRMALPPEVLGLAELAIAEADHVHRASDLRAGPIASLLERVQAQARPHRFEQLLEVCLIDWSAYPGHGEGDYAKAPRPRRALAAWSGVAGSLDDAGRQARAEAVARALQPPRI